MRILVFDTETSGLPIEKNPPIYHINKWPHLLQLSYIVFNISTNEIEKTFDEYVFIGPDVKIDPQSTKIHGITNRKCIQKGKDLKTMLNTFKENMLECDQIVAHNISFDMRILMVEGIRNNVFMKFKDNKFCTMKNSVNLCCIERISSNGEKYFKYPTMSELYFKLFNKNPKNTHDSFVDILCCLQCYMQMYYDNNLEKTNKKFAKILKVINE